MNLITQLRMSENTLRGTGRTTEQIRTAPQGAIYICLDSRHVHHCKGVAKELGRVDVTFVAENPYEAGNNLRGTHAVIVDHSVAYRYAVEALESFYARHQPPSPRPNTTVSRSVRL